MSIQNRESQSSLSPRCALDLLKNGNRRFVSNLQNDRNMLHQVNATKDGQYPFAVILSCIDSRTSAELIFDLGLGDIFSVRIAGNVLNEDILGSMEFACKIAGSKLILVLGHTRCGAVKGACEHVEMGNLTTLLNKIFPVVRALSKSPEAAALSPGAFVERVAEENVRQVLRQIPSRSPILADLIEQGHVGIAGGLYDIESGEVSFFDEVF
jgi:carbonic anhydrase